jgi:NTE family protein
MANTTKNVALVLSSGGARGIAQIAVIDELIANGYNITSVAGSSIGAVIGGLYASGTLTEYKNWIAKLDYWDVFNLLDFSLSSKGFIKGERVFKKIDPYIANKEIENLSIPFVAVASDIVNKRPVIYRKGNLRDAIRASVSIPTVLHPVETEDGLIVDGGVVNPIPVNLVERTPGDILVVVDVNAHISVEKAEISKKQQSVLNELSKRFFAWNKAESRKRSNLGIFDMMNESFDLTQEMLTASLLHQYKPDILIRISRKTCGAMEFHRYAEVMEIGRNAAVEGLRNYESKIKRYNST